VRSSTFKEPLRIATLFFELKNELGEGGCDPSSQAILTYAREVKNILRHSPHLAKITCFPAFIVGMAGPAIWIGGKCQLTSFWWKIMQD
jgi:hypothetical protein